MNHGEKLALVLAASGALVAVEFLGEKKVHGEFNVPAPTATINQMVSNVTATALIFNYNPMGYQTGAARPIIEIKG